MKRNTLTAAAVAAALMGLTGAGIAQQTTAGASTDTAGSMAGTISPADRLFMTRAADGNMAEVMTSQMALKRGDNGEVKTVAQMLIQEHGTAQQDLMKLAGQKGVMLPPTLGPTHTILSMMLARESGSKFDKDFIGAQVEDHENTIALFQQEIAAGQDPDVKAYASQYLPKIVGHTAMIYGAAEGVGVMAMKFRPTTPPAAGMAGMTGAMGTGATGTVTTGSMNNSTTGAGAGTTTTP